MHPPSRPIRKTSPSPSSYQPTDPIISSNFSPFSPSASRVRRVPNSPGSDRMLASPTSPFSNLAGPSESDALLGTAHEDGSSKKPFYRPRPMWLVPFAIAASVSRGMTLAPRVSVFTQLSCNAIHGSDVYDHISVPSSPSLQLSRPLMHTVAPLFASLDPAGPHLDILSANNAISFPAGSLTKDTEDDEEPDPRAEPSQRCLSDPAVQAGAARIQTIMTITMGMLSALTTGWWGHYGERHGRTRVLAASTLGLLLTDLTFILVSTPHSPFATHGHKLLILSPFLEGALGGWSTLQGATSAYISDCTSDGSRAQIFSRFTGVFYLGFSLGPMLGAFLIRHPWLVGGDNGGAERMHGPGHGEGPLVTTVFYVAACCSFINLLLVLFVFPESLDKKHAKIAAAAVAAAVSAQSESQSVGPGGSASSVEVDVRGRGRGLAVVSRVKVFLGPLAMFVPKKMERPGGNGAMMRDWSLTLLGMAFFAYLLASGIYQLKYLYAEHVYGWDAEELSYYISWVGGVRAIHLLVIMPFLISTFKPKPKLPAVPGTILIPHAKKSKPALTLTHLAREMSFDVLLLRLSFLIDLASHTLVFLAPPAFASSGFFVAFTTLSSFGSGVVPAVNSLALSVIKMRAIAKRTAEGEAGGDGALGDEEEDGGAGRLFGAFAVLQAVGQTILGPMLFGVVYSTTVAQYPKAIFTTAAGILFVAVALLCLLRPEARFRRPRAGHESVLPASPSLHSSQSRPPSYQGAGRRELERGRSRVSKDLGAGYVGSASLGSPSAGGSGSGSGSESGGARAGYGSMR